MSKLIESLEGRQLMSASATPGGVSLDAGTLTIRHGGDLQITEAADGSWSYKMGAKAYGFSAAQVAAIKVIEVANRSTNLDLSAKAADDEDFTVIGKGAVNISGVAIQQATTTSSFNADTEIAGITFKNEGGVTVNGTRAGYFQTTWDELDDTYGTLSSIPDGANVLNGAGVNGYNNATPLPQPVFGQTTLGPAALAVNKAFIQLGVDYIAYLEQGNEALTTVVAKSNTSGRMQSIHDNILSNLNAVQIDFRNIPGMITEAEIASAIPGDWELRASYNGFADSDAGDLQASVKFDFDHGVNRSDYAFYGLGL